MSINISLDVAMALHNPLWS